MAEINFSLPGIIRFGRGVRFRLADVLPDGAVLVLCGRHSAETLARRPPELFGKREVEVFAEIPPEIPLDAVEKAREIARRTGARSVVGWGGGSAIDAAKATAALLDEVHPVADFFYGKRIASRRKCFFAALPTTAGTGAEVTANAVLHDPETDVKQSLRTIGMAPDVALVDPELAENAPFPVMAASGMDALTQAIESFVSKKADEATRFLAAWAAKDLFSFLADACRHDRKSVDAVCRASLAAGIAFSKSGLGAVHGLAHPLGCVKKIPHGMACAVLLGIVFRANRKRAPEIYAQLDAALGLDAEKEISRLAEELAIPERFEGTLSEKEMHFIVSHSRSGSMKCNPVEFSDGELGEIVRAAFTSGC